MAQDYITKHMPINKAYLWRDPNHVPWDRILEVSGHILSPPELESTKPLHSILQNLKLRKDKSSTKDTRQKSDDSLSSMSVCNECTPDSMVGVEEEESNGNINLILPFPKIHVFYYIIIIN